MKKFFIFFSFFILTSTVFASTANPTIGGWQIISNVGQGIGAKLTASKEVMINGVSKTVTSVASVSPSPKNVGKFLLKTGVTLAVTTALDSLLDGVDYVMDPANNTLTYKTKPVEQSARCSSFESCSSFPTLWYSSNYPQLGYYSDRLALGRAIAPLKYVQVTSIYIDVGCVWADGKFTVGNMNQVKREVIYCGGSVSNPAYNPSSVPSDQKTVVVPISEVGSRVIEQAEKDIKAGNPSSPAVVIARAAAQDVVSDQVDTDNPPKIPPPIAQELEKNATIPSDTTAEGEIVNTDPITGELTSTPFSMEFPDFCSWASSICLFIDWIKTDPELEDLELPTEESEELELDEKKIRISSSECSDIHVDLGKVVFGDQFTKRIEMREICSELSPLKYILKLITLFVCILLIWRY